MAIKSNLLTLAEHCTNQVFAALPKGLSQGPALASIQLIGHRGDHDGRERTAIKTLEGRVAENTIAAFDRCLAAGVWGIEFDLQWTRNGVPMVIHDVDAGRVFNRPDVVVAELTDQQLRQRCPLIPSLEQVIDRYAGRLHLMIELKAETWRRQYAQTLVALLNPLVATADYHLLSLNTNIFRDLTDIAPHAHLPVATANTQKVYEYAIKHPCAGMSGHFVLLNRRMRSRLAAQQKNWGTGFIGSHGALRKEIRSGTRWLFSNHAVSLQVAVNQALRLVEKTSG